MALYLIPATTLLHALIILITMNLENVKKEKKVISRKKERPLAGLQSTFVDDDSLKAHRL